MRTIVFLFASCLFFLTALAQCDSTFFRYTATVVNDVSLIDTNQIIAVGSNGYIIKSMDGGKRWKNINTFVNTNLAAVQMVADGVGYAVGESQTILKTENHGDTWFPLFPVFTAGNSNRFSHFSDLYFFDKNRGVIVGSEGKVLSTVDGGKSWKDTTLGWADNLKSISFADDSTGYICGPYNFLYKTTDWGHYLANA